MDEIEQKQLTANPNPVAKRNWVHLSEMGAVVLELEIHGSFMKETDVEGSVPAAII